MKITRRQLRQIIKEEMSRRDGLYVVIGNAGRGRQTLWPKSEEPGTFTMAEAEKIALEKKAEGYAALLENPDYLRLETMKTAYHNSKIVIGEIPKNGIFNFAETPKTGYTEPVYLTNA